MHKTLGNLVTLYITDDHQTWPDLVPISLWTIQSTTSFLMGFSPFMLMYGEDLVSMGMPETGVVPDSLNNCELYMQTRDRIARFRYMAEHVV